jgi:hypothetical protein
VLHRAVCRDSRRLIQRRSAAAPPEFRHGSGNEAELRRLEQDGNALQEKLDERQRRQRHDSCEGGDMRLLGWSLAGWLILNPAPSAAQESESVGSLPPVEEAPPPPPRAEAVTPVTEGSQLPAQPPPPTGVALAQYSPPPQPLWLPRDEARGSNEPARSKRRWYGGQTLVADAAAIGLFVAAAGSADGGGSGMLLALSGLTYLVAPPIIHGAHDRAGVSFASLGVRAGLPLTGMMLGKASASCGRQNDEMFCGLGEAVIGFSLGALSAMAIDAAFLAWEPVPLPERAANRLRITPAIAPVQGGASAGVLGVF